MANKIDLEELGRNLKLYRESNKALDPKTKEELSYLLAQAYKTGKLGMFTTGILIIDLYEHSEGLSRFHDLVPLKEREDYYNGLAKKIKPSDWRGLRELYLGKKVIPAGINIQQ